MSITVCTWLCRERQETAREFFHTADWFLSGAAGIGGWSLLSTWEQPRSGWAHGPVLLKSSSGFSEGWRFQALTVVDVSGPLIIGWCCVPLFPGCSLVTGESGWVASSGVKLQGSTTE